MRRQSIYLEKCVDKVFFWRNASTKCFSGEMRRPSVFLENCVDKVFFGRNASTKRNSVCFEKKREQCVEKMKFDQIKEQCVEKVKTPFFCFKNGTSKMVKNDYIWTKQKWTCTNCKTLSFCFKFAL